MAQSPCPHRIVDDMGYAFCMGSIGGAVWHCVKGYRNSPPGFRARLTGSTKAIAARAPVLGGNFAVWGLCFSSFDCIYLHLRRKDDPLNAIAAGASTGAALAWRAGLSSMAKSAMVGGVFLAVIEGLGLGLQKMMTPSQPQGPISPYSTYKPGDGGLQSMSFCRKCVGRNLWKFQCVVLNEQGDMWGHWMPVMKIQKICLQARILQEQIIHSHGIQMKAGWMIWILNLIALDQQMMAILECMRVKARVFHLVMLRISVICRMD